MRRKGFEPFIERQLPVPCYLYSLAGDPGSEKTSFVGNNQRRIVPVYLFQFLHYPKGAFHRPWF